MHLLHKFMIVICAVAIAESVVAQDIPVSALQEYSDLRSKMILYGWTPDLTHGGRDETGKRPPEVICGRAMCSARWLDKKGAYIDITLWFDASGTYRVAPQIEWQDE